ncbi:uncharacterized protein [Palaemon carinicauda]|uniref:uncharacterized protein n=1 Tax=Palaemon carinicauda TaxID=392227 RepID=UPI0035B6842B
MATTVTTGVTIGVGSLAAGAAVAAAGAVGLGLLGVAHLFRRDNNKSYGNSHGHGHGYGYGHRHRRTAEEDEAAISNILNLIRQEDITGCGLKFMCELARRERASEELALEELSVLSLVGTVVTPDEGPQPEGAVGEYTRAKALGMEGGNCSEAYPLCALNGTQLMETVMAYLP